MPNSVDNKIVEMQFDNANFEKNVKQSIKTLEALNKALELEDAAKGFEQMEKAVDSIDLSKLTRAADVIEKRFSAAGIAGAALIQRGVNGAINLVGKLGSTVVNLAKTGGIRRALNLEHANFMLNGIIKDAEKVAAIMDGPVNNAVSGTAYGLDAAAKAAGQFAASGVTDLKKLEIALTGISGVAAMTSSEYDDIAQVFTKVAAAGRMMGGEALQLSKRGIAVHETLAKYMNKTVAEVQEMQKKGQISFEIFANAMNDAFGDQAKKANETFTGAMSNVKAALSRIGAKIATPTIENLRRIFVTLIGVINKINNLLSEKLINNVNKIIDRISLFIRVMLSSSKFMTLVEKTINNLTNGFEVFMNILHPFRQAFKAIFPGDAIDRLITFNDMFAAFIKKLEMSTEKANAIKFTLQGVFAVIDILFNIIKQVFGLLLPGASAIYDVTDSLSTKILKVTGFIGFLLTKLDKWLKENNLLKAGINAVNDALSKLTSGTNIFGNIIQGIGIVLGGVIYVFYTIGSAIAQFIKQAYELPIVKTIVNELKNAIIRLGEYAAPILIVIADGFISLMDSLERFSKGQYITNGLEKLNDALSNVYWGAKNTGGAISSFFNIFKKGDSAIEKIDKVYVANEKLYNSMKPLAVSGGTLQKGVGVIESFTEATTTLADESEASAKKMQGTMTTLDEAGHIFAIGFGASIISAGINIGRGFREIGRVARNLKSTTKAISLFFDQLQLNLRIKTLMSLAATIVIFAGALALLTQLNPGRLALAAGIVGALMAALTYLGKGLAKSDSLSIKRFQAASKGIFELSGAILVLALAAKLLSSAVGSWKQLASMIAGMITTVILVGALAAAVVFIGNTQKKAIAGASAMLAIASSIYIVMASLQKIVNLDYDKIWKALPIMLSIVSGLAGLALAMSITISPFGGFAFLGVVAGILLLMEGLQMLQAVDAKAIIQAQMIIDQIVAGITHIIWALALIQGLKTVEALFNWLPWIGAKMSNGLKGMFAVLQRGVKYIGVAAIIITIGVSIKLIGDTLISLGAMWEHNKASMIAGVGFVAGIAALILAMTETLAILLTATFEASQYAKAIGPALIGISAIILSFTAAIAIFGNMKPEVFATGLFAVVFLTLIITGFVALLSLIQKEIGPMLEGSIKTLVGLGIFIGLMVASVAVLGIIPIEDAIRGTIMLSALLLVLSGVFKSVAKMSSMTKAATASVFAMIGIFAVLGGVMYMLKDVYTSNVILNLVTILGAVAIMSLIIYGLSKIKSNLKTGALVVASISGILLVLSAAGLILEQVEPEKLTKNLIALGVAMGALAVAMGILGAISTTIVGGVAITAGIGILRALAGVLVVVSGAALIFGVAANFIGNGLTDISRSLNNIKDVDFDRINSGLMSLQKTLVGISLLSSAIDKSTKSLNNMAPVISNFGGAVIMMTKSLMVFDELDLKSIMVNLIKLGEAIEFVNQRALAFGEFSIIAIAVGASCGVLGAGLITATGGMIGFAAAMDMVCLGISIIVASFRSLGEIVLKIVDSMTNMVDSLKSMGAETVESIYDTLIKFASTELPKAGSTMMIYVKDGFIDAIDTCASEILTGLISGFGAQLALRQTEIYGVGYKMAEYFKLGMIDSFEINSPSKVSMRNVDYIVDGYEIESDRQSGSMEDAGYNLGESYGKGLKDAIEDAGEDSVYDTVHTMSVKSSQYENMAYEAGETLGEAFDEGVRDPTGSYCINITGDDSAYDTAYTMQEKAKEYAYMAENGGNTLGNSFGEAAATTTNSWLSGISTTLREWAKNPMGYKGGLLSGNKEDNALGNKLKQIFGNPFEGFAKEYEEKLKETSGKGQTLYNKYWAGAGVGWVNRQGQKVNDFNVDDYLNKTSDALDEESGALDGNTKATKGSSKAKKENEKANDKKTKAINEETEALNEETEAVEDNEQAIRDQAEQIEIVTEKFKDYLNAYKFADPMRNALRLNKAFSKLWSSNDKTLKDVNASYKKASDSLSKSLKTINKQVLKFNDSGKYIGKFSKSLYKNTDKIEKKVLKTGKTLMKVMGPSTKVFYKVGNSVETMTITTTKNLKKLGKHFAQAKNFLHSFNSEIEHQESSEEFILNLRNIERFFGATKFGKMSTKAKDYIRGIVDEFSEVNNSMNILAKNIDGIGNVLSKKSKASAYVADSFLALAASMYDGSDAANEYATEHAKLLFLLENGLATQEEVDEHFQSYISRLKQTIVDYRNTIYENLSGSMDIFSKFNQNLLEEGTDLISNIESQIAGYYNWGNMLMELSKRGFDSGIIKMLTDEGVSSFGKAKALMEMTGDELALFTIRYQQSQAVIEHATDTALAAVANAQTRASLRAAAAQGDKTAQAQLKQSKKNKQALMDDVKAVADYQAKYNKLNAKEEKKYLKSLSKEERKEYKRQLKAAKKQQNELKKAAKNEEAKRAEEDRIATIKVSIETFNDYINAISKYNEDSAVMKNITESIAKSFEPLNGALMEFSDVTRDEAINSLLYFAETLEATGNEGNDYFTEMTQRLQNYISTLKDAIKSQLTFTDAIKITQNGYSPDKFVGNMTGNLAKAADVQTLTQQLMDKYGTANVNNIVADIARRLKDNGSIGEVLEILNAYIGMTREEIMAMNSALLDADKVSEKLANQMLVNVSKATMDSGAEKRLNEAKERINELTDSVKYDQYKLEEATKDYQAWYDTLKDNEAKIASTSVAILKLEKKQKDKGLTKKEKQTLQEYKMNLKAYQDANKDYQEQVNKRKAIMESAEEAYNSSTRDLAGAQNELTEAQKAYDRALAKFNEARANEENLRERQAAEQRLEAEAYAILNLITSYDTLIGIEKKYSKETRIMTKVTSGMKVVIQSVSGAIDEYGRRWKNVTNLSKKVNSDVDIITRAFLRMSDTLTSSGELTGTYFENAAQKLSEYRDTLYDTIKGQVSLFDTFNKSSGDKMTSASTYLDNMQSQLIGLEEWLTGLETLAKRGINGDILQVFAAEGQGSYEKVMAFVNATDEQLGELMDKYNEYNALTAAAADRAMAAIGSTYTDAAMKASKDLIDLFHRTGATRLQEEAYNAGLMIITGVKNGLGNSMPEIISVTGDTADAVSSTLSNTIGQSIGKAINTGVVQAVGNSVETTVNAAIEKFKMAVDTVNSYVQETLNDEWSITVHVNTSEIDAAVARMNSAIYGINAQATTTQDAYVSSRQSAMPTVDIEPVQTAPTQDVVLNYTQNNYSPSALSRAEIYRQTRNQLSTIEGVVSAATGG